MESRLAILDKLYAILRRDLFTAVRYRAGFAFLVVSLFIQLSAFYFLARAIGPGFRPGNIDYFPYLLVGTGFYTFFVMSTQAFLGTIQQAQQTGTMEVLMTTSTAPAQLVVLSSISAFAGNLLNLGAYVMAGVAIFGAPVHANLLTAIIVLMLGLVIALALGISAAALQVWIQKGSALVWLLGSGLWFLSGAMFPIEKLPQPLLLLSRCFPLYYAIDGMRRALLEGASLRGAASTVGALLAFDLILLPLALWGFAFSLRRARQNGTLSFY